METKKTQEQIVVDNFKNWEDALKAKDIEKIVRLYSNKHVLFLPTFSDKLVNNLEGVRDYFIHFFEKNPEVISKKGEFIFSPDESSYTHVGMYDFEVDDENGSRKVVNARFTYNWEKSADDNWKIIHHHSSATPQAH